MLRSEAIAIIKRGLGFRQTQDAAIIAALKEAQRDLELGQTLPNWLLLFYHTIPVLAGNPYVILPSIFIRLHEDYPLTFTNTASGDVATIMRRHNDEAYTAYNATDDGGPKVFVQNTKDQITLIPTPQTAGTVTITYYAAANVLDSEMENLWLKNAPNYLVGLAGMKVAGDLRDKGALDRFTKMAQMGNKSMLGDVVEDELAGRALVMGRNN